MILEPSENQLSRIGTFRFASKSNSRKLSIYHHPENGNFWEVRSSSLKIIEHLVFVQNGVSHENNPGRWTQNWGPREPSDGPDHWEGQALIDHSRLSRLSHWYTGWWLGHPSETYEFVNWDDYSILFPIYGKIKNGNQTTNQYIIGINQHVSATLLQGGAPPVMWMLVYKPQEYSSNKYLINHSEIGLINQLSERTGGTTL